MICQNICRTIVAELHHFYAAPVQAMGKNFDAALALISTLLYCKLKFLTQIIVNMMGIGDLNWCKY
jgi:hypothetical protein